MLQLRGGEDLASTAAWAAEDDEHGGAGASDIQHYGMLRLRGGEDPGEGDAYGGAEKRIY